MTRVLMVSDATAREPVSLAREVRAALEPAGYSVETSADTEAAAARLRQEDFALLIVQVPSIWQCPEGVRLLLAEVRGDPERKGPAVFLFIDRGGDGASDPGYWAARAFTLLSHSWHPNELRAYVQRSLENW